MTQLRLPPTDSRLQELSLFQWILLDKAFIALENRKRKDIAEVIEGAIDLVGLRFGSKIIPLTGFINPEMFKELIDRYGFGGEDLEKEALSEEVDEEAENIFATDISVLFEEDINKAKEIDEEYRRMIEEKVGVIVIGEEESDGG